MLSRKGVGFIIAVGTTVTIWYATVKFIVKVMEQLPAVQQWITGSTHICLK